MSKSNTNYKKIYKKYEPLVNRILHTHYIQIDYCNDFVLPIDWDFKNRINPNFHMAYVRKGKGSYIYGNNQKDDMIKGKLYFFTSGFCHSRILDKSQLPHMILLRYNLIHSYTRKAIIVKEPFGFSINDNHNLYATLLSKLVSNYHEATKKYGQVVAATILEQMLYELMNDITVQLTPKITDSRLRKTAEYIHENIGQHITLDELCQIAGLSKNYYRKLFKAQYGLYPKAYIIQVRLEQAEQLLMETENTIKDIAQSLGYSDAYSFSKQFKDKKGYSPSGFRNYIKPTGNL
ncbi:MAG: AraC family transcriptional regulator [Vallitalea sp.]|jgi:AraC-like DNA-binding protein|nr:AraC family transcriptional regulator [Vallitalea sp.]